MRQKWWVPLILVAVGACGSATGTEPRDPDDDDPGDEPTAPPPETGAAFHLSFDGLDDRVL